MAAKSTLRNMVLCLTLVCLLCSAILGVVYAVTYDPIRKASQKALQEALSLVLPPEGTVSTEGKTINYNGVDYQYYEQKTGDEISAWAVKSIVNGFGGPLTVLVGIQKGGKIFCTKVLEHSETPGLGAKCQTDEGFLDQFKGFDAKAGKLVVSKDGGDIDAITASTITSRAYTLAVANAVTVAGMLESPANDNVIETEGGYDE